VKTDNIAKLDRNKLQALNADNETGRFQWKNDIGIMSNLKNVKEKYRWKCIVKKELLHAEAIIHQNKREFWV